MRKTCKGKTCYPQSTYTSLNLFIFFSSFSPLDIVSTLRARFVEEILEDKKLALTAEQCERVAIDTPPPNAACDLATNAALVLAKTCAIPPLLLAQRLQPLLDKNACVEKSTIAPPGFINITLSNDALQQLLASLLAHTEDIPLEASRSDHTRNINIEFVSANPTGPLHIGHTRGAVVGDVLANLLERQGHKVRREYYINDRGEQMTTLARSLHWRYRQLFDKTLEGQQPPQGLYPGSYLKACAQQLRERDGDKWLSAPSSAPAAPAASAASPAPPKQEHDADNPFWLTPLQAFAREQMMETIRHDLQTLGVRFDSFVSERKLVAEGAVERLLQRLQTQGVAKHGTLPAPKAARASQHKDKDKAAQEHLLLETQRFGDSENRVLQTHEGKITYFATDLAYHLDKLQRGAQELIDVFGADHSGHALRLHAALKACHDGKKTKASVLAVVSCQIVRLMEDGKPLKMSKRGGAFLDLRSLLERVGKDAVRFLMLTRKTDAPLDFDLQTAIAQSHDNPVFYAQYAHARCCSVLRIARCQHGIEEDALKQADPALLEAPAERRLLRNLALFPRTTKAAAQHLEPHRLAFAVTDLAASLHAWWNEGNKDRTKRILPAEKIAATKTNPVTLARLALVKGAQRTLETGLELCGVTAPQEMT